MQASSNVIDKNWKALIKPNKLDITSNEDKIVAKAEAMSHLKRFWSNNRKLLEKNIIVINSGCSSDSNSNRRSVS